MSLAKKLEAAKPVYKPRFEQYVESLSQQDREALIAAAVDPSWSTAALIRVLRDDGVTVGKDGFTAWRNRVAR